MFFEDDYEETALCALCLGDDPDCTCRQGGDEDDETVYPIPADEEA